jgi:hypothetical protein
MAAACCLFIASCAIPFPTNNPLPYTGGEFTRVYVGSTSDDVVELLGQPQIKLQGGSLWVYGRTRAASTDGLGGYTHDYRAILIEFSEGAVASKDIVHGEYLTMPACWSEAHSLCLWPQWDSRSGANDEPKILSRRYSAVTSLREDDEQAKRFEPDDGQCAVYVYSDGNLFSILPVLSIGTARDEPVPMGGYLNFQSPPQRLQLMAGENTADVDCQAGSLHFYKLGKYLATDGDNIHIKSVNPDEGRKAISWRHLLLTW